MRIVAHLTFFSTRAGNHDDLHCGNLATYLPSMFSRRTGADLDGKAAPCSSLDIQVKANVTVCLRRTTWMSSEVKYRFPDCSLLAFYEVSNVRAISCLRDRSVF